MLVAALFVASLAVAFVAGVVVGARIALENLEDDANAPPEPPLAPPILRPHPHMNPPLRAPRRGI